MHDFLQVDGLSYLSQLKGTMDNEMQQKDIPRILRHYCGSSLHAVRLMDGMEFFFLNISFWFFFL